MPSVQNLSNIDPAISTGSAALLVDAWRRAEAKKGGVSPYVVAHDAMLKAIAAKRPNDNTTLAAVFGPKRTEKYGEGVLQVLAQA